MANVKITGLTAASAAAKSMLFEVTQDPGGTPATRKLSLDQILRLDDGTRTSDAPLIDMVQTWNDSGTTFTGLKFNIAAVAAASGSMLIDLQVGGASKFKVTKDALLTTTAIALGAGSASVPSLTFGDADTGLYAHTAGGVAVSSQGAIAMRIHSDGSFASYGPYSLFSYDLIIGDAADVSIARLGIATVGLRNYGTPSSPVTLQVYNTYTDGSNYERGVFDWQTTSNVLTIGTQKAGTGSTRGINFAVGGANIFGLNPNGLDPETADVFHIGYNRRIHTLYALQVFTQYFTMSSGISITDGGATGIFLLRDTAGTGWDRIQLGGTTSSFPAIKRVSAGFKFVVADDSASAAVEALSYTSGAPAGGAGAGTWKLGTLVTAAVTPDATRYVEVDIGGTLLKFVVGA